MLSGMSKGKISEVFRLLLLQSYKAYCLFSHDGRWICAKASAFLCDTLQEFLFKKTNNAYDILVLSMPPQHGKSMTVTETLPSWFLLKNPQKRVIEISYSEDFARLFGRKNKQKIDSLGHIFGIHTSSSPASMTEFEIKGHGGGMISRGVMSGVTGRPCDLMIIDDPIKNRMEADSEVYRERLWQEWQDSFKTRLASGAKVIIIQTRWHEDDLAGRIIKNEKNVQVLSLTCEAETGDILKRKPGSALMPEIGKDDAWLRDIKSSYSGGQRTWNALYQGRPSSQKGNIIKREWFKRYDTLPELKRIVISVDAAFKDSDNSDNVAVSVWGKKGADMYLIEMICGKMDFTKTVREIVKTAKKYPKYNCIYIEDKANGSAVISYLKKTLRGIIGITPEGGKVSRVNAVCGMIEAGNVHLPKAGENIDAFIEECAAFPRGAHDDMVDSMTQALIKEYFKNADTKEKTQTSRQFSFGETKKEDIVMGRDVFKVF